MARYDPSRADAVSHAGTFNNNVISMAAGLAGLRDLYTPAAADRLNEAGDRLRERLNALAAAQDAPLQALGVGSIMALHFHRGPVSKPQDLWSKDAAAAATLADLQKLLHLDLLDQGQYMARRGFISLSLPMTEAELGRFAAAVEEFLVVRGPVVRAAIG
jgi:glutamate-1-semialdehyde 2,1-aminomutase